MTKIFVFGSNLAGRHGAGAALYALKAHGANYGQGYGLQGNSYAIPTKNHRLEPLPLQTIATYIETFKLFALQNPEMIFQVTAIGTGLAGYTHTQIAPMFRNSPSNCILPKEWKDLI